MIRRTRPIRISLGDVPSGATSRRIPEAKAQDPQLDFDPKLTRPTRDQLFGDMNAAVWKVQQRQQFALGAAPRRHYVNKYSALFFQELDKGTRSPWVVGAYLLCAFLGFRRMYQLMYGTLAEEREHNLSSRPQDQMVSAVPFVESHNLAMGLRNKHRVSGGNEANYAGESELLNKTTAEDAVQPPRLIYTEKSEGTLNKDDSPTDMVIIERREYDRAANRDAVYRMAQYIFDEDVDEARDDAKALKKVDKDLSAFERKKREWLNALPMARRQERVRPDHVHAMVKCKGIDASTQNCIPASGDAQLESTRKLLLGLGPVHMLRDPQKITKRNRISEMKEITTNMLVLGLHGGEFPNAIRHFNNFQIDVVEKDPSMARIARNFLGFKENSTMKLTLSDPAQYVRRLAAEPNHKRYDFVVVDALDGKGRFSPNLNRLEFIEGVRNIMEKAGVVAVNVPNDDPQFFMHILQNWRMGFENGLMLLAHCSTSQNTVLLAFQDAADRGKPIMGSCGSPDEFGEVVKTFLTHYGKDKALSFDLLREIDPYFFKVISASQKLDLASVLPPNHPALRDKKYMEKMSAPFGGSGGSRGSGLLNPSGGNAYDRGTLAGVDIVKPYKTDHKEY